MTCQGSSNLAEPILAVKRDARLAALLFECYFAVEYFYVILESQFSCKNGRKQVSFTGNPCKILDWLIIKTLIEVVILDVICVVRAKVVVV